MQTTDMAALLQTITSFGVVVWEKLPVAGFAVLFSNAAARHILGESLTEAPRPEVARVFDQALSAPGSEVRMEVLGGVGREPFLARVFGLVGAGRLVAVHLHTPDYPLVQVVRDGAAARPAAPAASAAATAAASAAAVEAAASAMNMYSAARGRTAAETQSEMMLLQSLSDSSGARSASIDFSPPGTSLRGSSFEFLLGGSIGSEELPVAAFEWNAAGECVMANRAMRELLGYAAVAPHTQLGLAAVVAPQSQAQVQQMVSELLAGPAAVAGGGGGGGGGASETGRTAFVTVKAADGSDKRARMVLSKPAGGANGSSRKVVCGQLMTAL